MTTGQGIVLAAGLWAGGIIAAGPASRLLAGARWPQRAPRPTLLLWQALCLGAGLSFIGGPLVFALHPLGPDLPTALRVFLGNLLDGRPLLGLSVAHIVAGVVSAGIAALLTVALVVTFVRTVRRRRAHREVIDLIAGSREIPGRTGVSVVDHPSAVAYTLPGWHARVVLSAGLLDLLDPAETAAVLEHEQAHLRIRDDLLQLPFQTWAAGLGRLPGVEQGRRAVAELAEMLADDIALARSSPPVLAGALAKVAIAGSDGSADDGDRAANPIGSHIAGSPGDTGRGAVLTRVQRLLHPDPLGAPARAGIYLLAVAVIAVPTWLLLLGWA